MNKFKVGDKIRREYGNPGHIAEFIDNSTIIEFKGNEVWIKLPNGNKDWFHKDFLNNGGVILVNHKNTKPQKPKKVTHIIIYDIEDKDPVIFCYSKREMKKEVETLFHKDEVKKESIRIIEVKKELKPVTSVSIKEVK